MKKTYKKPMASIEYFALTQSIAACSPGLIIHLTGASCIIGSTLPPQWWDLAEGGLFMDATCSNQPNIGDEYSGVCFHTNASPTFTS